MPIWRDISDSEDAQEGMTDAQKDYVGSVGGEIYRRAGLETFFKRWNSRFGFASDCSGTDTPFMALSHLFAPAKKKHLLKHLTACDINDAAQRFLQTNYKMEEFREDVFRGSLKHWGCKVAAFCAGFPCQPYSSLHFGSRLMEEANAKQLGAVVAHLKQTKPCIGLLENVCGIVRVMAPVEQLLTENLGKEYLIAWRYMDPTEYGSPIGRKRVYFFLLRRDLMIPMALDDFEGFLDASLAKIKHDPTTSWTDLLLPRDHPRVAADVSKRTVRATKMLAKKKNLKGFKWVKRHREWSKKNKVTMSSACGSFREKYPLAADQIGSQRELQALDLMTCAFGGFEAINVSQSLGRMPCLNTTDSRLMCLTPAGQYLIGGDHQRFLTGFESMVLMGWPMDDVDTSNNTDEELKKLAGNGMSMHVVTAALAVSLLSVCPKKMAKYLQL